MRPYPGEILRSMQFSLDTYVIPNVEDKWGSYVAKVMRRMLIHLERRWQLEGPLLIEDTHDLRDVLAQMGDRLTNLEGDAAGDTAAHLIDLVGTALDETAEEPSGYVSIEQLTGRNERLREALVGLIEGLDRLAGEVGHEQLDPLRHDLRLYLRRQTDRDKQLAEPTFMSFSPRTEKKDAKGEAA